MDRARRDARVRQVGAPRPARAGARRARQRRTHGGDAAHPARRANARPTGRRGVRRREHGRAERRQSARVRALATRRSRRGARADDRTRARGRPAMDDERGDDGARVRGGDRDRRARESGRGDL